MNEDFKDVMSKRTDEELIKIVTIDRNDYQPMAVIVAEEEIKKRNIDYAKVEQVKTELKTKIEEKKDLDSKTVSSSLRLVHFIIDTIVWLVAISILGFLLSILPFSLSLNNELTIMLIGYAILFVTFICYYYIMEVKYQKTVAKFITRTKVVTNNGHKPSKRNILVRTFCRLIPLDRISFLFTRNGLHDRLSGTQVIKDDRIED